MVVTNRAAQAINARRLAVEFPEAAIRLEEDGVPCDEKMGGGYMVFMVGMRIRLSRNVDKDRGFVNGALGVVEHVLRKDVFVFLSTRGVRILIHPVHMDGKVFMPCAYAYDMTIRRAQGSTLDLVGLYFDRACADRGYAYVGASRVRLSGDLWLVGPVRRTDWLPVGEDPDGGEQLRRGVFSDSSDSDGDPEDAFDDQSDEEDDDRELEEAMAWQPDEEDDDAEPEETMAWHPDAAWKAAAVGDDDAEVMPDDSGRLF